MRKPFRKLATAVAIAAALFLLNQAPAAALSHTFDARERIAERVLKHGFLSLLWSSIRALWGEQGTAIPPGG
jgi:hypothetical protein